MYSFGRRTLERLRRFGLGTLRAAKTGVVALLLVAVGGGNAALAHPKGEIVSFTGGPAEVRAGDAASVQFSYKVSHRRDATTRWRLYLDDGQEPIAKGQVKFKYTGGGGYTYVWKKVSYWSCFGPIFKLVRVKVKKPRDFQTKTLSDSASFTVPSDLEPGQHTLILRVLAATGHMEWDHGHNGKSKGKGHKKKHGHGHENHKGKGKGHHSHGDGWIKCSFDIQNECQLDPKGITFTMLGDEPPTAVAQNVTVYLDASGNATVAPEDVDNGSSDDNGPVTLALSKTDFTAADLGDNTVTLTVTDSVGQTATADATVAVVDNLPPVAVAQNVTVYLGADGTVSVAPEDVDDGSSDNGGPVTLALSKTDFTADDLGENPVTLTVTDGAGLSATADAVVTVLDNAPPTAVAQNVTIYLDQNGQASVTPQQVDNGSSDNGGPVTLSLSQTSFTAANLGPNTVTLIVVDQSGLTATADAIVTVVDDIAPTALAQDVTIYLDESGQASTTPEDVDAGSSDNAGPVSLALSQTDFTAGDLGENPVTLTVTDGSGNSATAPAVVTVLDEIAPTAVAQNVTIYLDENGAASVTPQQVDAGSTDNAGPVTLALSKTEFGSEDLGDNPVTLTVTDGSGNSATADAVVTVVDNIPPVAIAQNVTISLDANGEASTTAEQVDNGSYDNGGPVTLALSQTDFTGDDLGENPVTLTVTAANGATATAEATVTVIDEIPPTALAQNLTVSLGPDGTVSITPDQIDNGSTDNVGVQSLSLDIDTFGASNIGDNPVVLTVTDTSGNSASASATVTVVDDTPPTVVTQDLTVYLDAAGQASITPEEVDNGSTDNVGIESMSLDKSTFTAADLGENTVVLTVTDVNGNSASETATITVLDNIPPEFTSFPGDIVETVDYPGTSMAVSWPAPTATDNSGVAPTIVQTEGPASGSEFPANGQPTTITYAATDGSGQTTTQSFTVTVKQGEPATVTFVVRSDADGSFGVAFGESTPVQPMTIATSGGQGSAYALVGPGAHMFSMTTPEGFGVTDATCDSGSFSKQNLSGEVSVVAGQAVVCTLEALDSRTPTTEVIGTLVGARADQIMAERPDIDRRIDRLTGRAPGDGGIVAFGVHGPFESAPFALQFDEQSAHFAFSMDAARRKLAGAKAASERSAALEAAGLSGDLDVVSGTAEAMPTAFGADGGDVEPGRFDVWVEGKYSKFAIDNGEGDFMTVFVGVDYVLGGGVLVGLSAQVDATSVDEMEGSDATASGEGFMVGPYLTARLDDQLYLDAEASWGAAKNKVSPFGTYKDKFDSERWLVTAGLIGDFQRGAWQFRPEARFAYYSEKTDAYTDSIGADIPSIDLSKGTLTFAPSVAYQMKLSDSGIVIAPDVTLKGVYTFASSSSEEALGAGVEPGADDGLRGRVEGRLRIYGAEEGTQLSAGGFFDGIGDAEYETWGGDLQVSIPLGD